ncbi:MAG: 50S ribosomal protein L10 [Bacilli bacterium]|jgi:ribosomal protein L10|nr:50S ribosomal protein L10 [Bacilli bacterium]
MNQQILAEKKEKVSAIDKVLKTSQTVVVVSFSGISVDEVNQLRIDLKKNNAKMDTSQELPA